MPSTTTALSSPQFKISTVVCITPGTRILTPNGYVLIETLKDNDIITTHDNRNVAIKKIYKHEYTYKYNHK